MDRTTEPTPEQQAQAHLVQLDAIELINRLVKEGVPPPLIMVGVGTAIADALMSFYGPAHVAPWFERQADLVRNLQGPS